MHPGYQQAAAGQADSGGCGRPDSLAIRVSTVAEARFPLTVLQRRDWAVEQCGQGKGSIEGLIACIVPQMTTFWPSRLHRLQLLNI